MKKILIGFAALLSLTSAQVARAAFHLMSINEVMTSYNGNPSVQFVEMRLLAAGQTVVSGSVLAAFDGSGAYVGDIATPGTNLTNGASGASWLFGTPAFAALGGAPTPDFSFPDSSLSLGGGMVCWGKPPTGQHNDPNKYIDCLAYGNYAGPANNHVCLAGWSDADGHSVVRTDTATNQQTGTTCADPATPQNNAGATTNLAATTACGAAPLPERDAVLLAPKPLTVTIPASATGPVLKNVVLKVRNAFTRCGAAGSDDTIDVQVTGNTCPGSVFTNDVDFDSVTPLSQTSVTLASRKLKPGKLLLSFDPADFSSINRKSPVRCRIDFTATSSGDDDNLSNNVAPLIITVVDRTQADAAATDESVLKAPNPIKITIADAATSNTKKVPAVVTNADIIPAPENPGHSIEVDAFDGTCPPGTMGTVDFDPSTPLTAENTATVKGNANKTGKVVVTADASQTSPNSLSPYRCEGTLTIPTSDNDNSNNTAPVVIDIQDKNDY